MLTSLTGQYDTLEWKFMQSFGDDNSSEDDLVTAVEFDGSGDYLAVGDKAGRICIFEGHTVNNNAPTRTAKGKKGCCLEYKFYTEFQSHEPEFDCLKSLEIEEKINMIKFAKPSNGALHLLATNDKTIKYWKVHEKKIKRALKGKGNFITPTSSSSSSSSSSLATTSSSSSSLDIPQLQSYQTLTTATPKRVYGNAHIYHINSISINSDGETFISADDLRINLWSFERSDESFNIIDIKPNNLEELTEVITSSAFHPSHCHLLLYSTSRGSIRMIDMRENAICDQHAKAFELDDDPSNKSFFSEIISSISDAKFTTNDGRYILSRDYLTMKLWDVNMEARPVAVIPIHDYLRVHLCDLYENDCIFDKFECAASSDGTRFVTGSYNNHFILHHTETQSSITIEALKDPPRRNPKGSTGSGNNGGTLKKSIPLSKNNKKKDDPNNPNTNNNTDDNGNYTDEVPNVARMDFGKKALHTAWHPSCNAVAVAGLNKLYIYQAINML